MIRKKLFAVLLCGALISVLFAGCGDKAKNDISNAASRVCDDIASTVSRVESAVESFFEPESSGSGLSSDGSGVDGGLSSAPGSGLDSELSSGGSVSGD